MAPHSSTLAWKIPWTEEPGELHAVHGVAKSRTQLSNFTFTFHFYALEKEMATHSSVLAWRIPGTGKPGGLPSMGSHRVGHDWSNLVAAAPAAYRMGSQRVGHEGATELNWTELSLQKEWNVGKGEHVEFKEDSWRNPEEGQNSSNLNQGCAFGYLDSFMIQIKRSSFPVRSSSFPFLVFSEETKF